MMFSVKLSTSQFCWAIDISHEIMSIILSQYSEYDWVKTQYWILYYKLSKLRLLYILLKWNLSRKWIAYFCVHCMTLSTAQNLEGLNLRESERERKVRLLLHNVSKSIFLFKNYFTANFEKFALRSPTATGSPFGRSLAP